MELVVFNMNENGNIVKAIKGETIGTVINKEEN
jgi:Uridylate kinase